MRKQNRSKIGFLGNLKLRTQFLFSFLVVAVLPFVFMGGLAITKSTASLSQQACNQLQSLQEIKK